MPIPDRFRLPPISDAELREYMDLSAEIEDGLEFGDDVADLLARWNRRMGREYEPAEFRYHGATDRSTFVTGALTGTPARVADLTYLELRAVLDEVLSARLSEAEGTYFVFWLEANLPGANVSDLIYWPNEWFKDQSMLHVALTPDQLLGYAMTASGRVLPDAPRVELPYPMPK
jgi:hypothetical protein